MKNQRKLNFAVILLTAVMLSTMLPLYASAATTYSGNFAAVNTNLTAGSTKTTFGDEEVPDLSAFSSEGFESGTGSISDVYVDPETGETVYIREKKFPEVELLPAIDREVVQATTPTNYSVGSTMSFLEDTGVRHEMKCLYVGTYCTVWGCTSDKTYSEKLVLTAAKAETIGKKYDEFAPKIKDAFGDAVDVDGDGKLAILCFDIDQSYQNGIGNSFTVGYFWSTMLADSNGMIGNYRYGRSSYSIGMDCICMDTFPGMGSSETNPLSNVTGHISTLVHENQHLINFSYRVLGSSYISSEMDTYLNEAFSMAAEHMICGSSSTESRINYFNNSSSYEQGHSLTYWTDDARATKLSNYATSYLFGQYIRTRYGEITGTDGSAIYRHVMELWQQNGGGNTLSLIAGLLGTTPKQLVLDFWAAIYLKNPTGWYGFQNEPWAKNISPIKSTSGNRASVGSGGAWYYSLGSKTMSATPASNIKVIQFNSDNTVTMDGQPQLSNLTIQRTAENKAKLSFTASLAGTLKYAPTEGTAVDPGKLTKSVTFSAGSNTVELDLSGRTSDTPTLSYLAKNGDFLTQIASIAVPAFQCSVRIEQPEHGTVSLSSGGQTITSGTVLERERIITVTATPDSGYELDSILVDGKPLDGDTFTVTSAHTVTAKFIQCSVSITQPTYGKITLSVNGSPVESGAILKRGQIVTVAVEPEEGCTLKSILVDGKAITGNTFKVTGAHTVSATFNTNSCGTNARWSLSNGRLKILGTGAMSNYSWANHPGWYNQCSSITSVEIASGITSIGKYAFYGCTKLESIFFRGKAPTFGNNCFYRVTATAYYDKNTSGWTSSVRANYGGTITWLDINDHASHQSGKLLETLTPETCTQNGLGKYQCACGEIIEKAIPALGHDRVHHAGQAATCTEGGWQAYDTCKRCDYTTYQTIAPLGHSYGTPTYTWTSAEDGYTCTATRVCTRDASHKETETVTATYAVTKEATLTADGTGTYTASFTKTAFAKQTKTITLKAAVADDTTDTVTVNLSESVMNGMVSDAAKAQDGTIQLDLSKYSGCDTVALPETLIDKICGNVGVKAATIQTAGAELTVDRNVLQTIDAQLDGGTVQFHIRPEAEKDLSQTQQGTWNQLSAAGENAAVVRVELSAVNGKETAIHELGGTAKIKVPYTLPQSMDGKKLTAYCIGSDGSLTAVPVEYANGYATILAQHFSDFVLLVSDSMFSASDGIFCRCDTALRKLIVSGSLSGKRLCLVSYAENGQMLGYTEVASAGEIALPEGAQRAKLLSLDAQCRPCAEQTVFEAD